MLKANTLDLGVLNISWLWLGGLRLSWNRDAGFMEFQVTIACPASSQLFVGSRHNM